VKLFESPQRLCVNGVALWAPRLPGWERARAILSGNEPAPTMPATRPAPELLPPNERRRAQDSVALALEVALAACRNAGFSPASLSCVFGSTHGDLAITDYMCRTLASAPAQLSPTRFHNSVHNAAAGYWTIGAACARPYTAISAGTYTFGAGLLEASAQALSGGEDILFVSYDIDARGPLASMAPSNGLLASAVIVGPRRGAHSLADFELTLHAEDGLVASRARAENAALVAGNASESCLPLLEALALGGAHDIVCLAGPGLGLALSLRQA
jgi:hypothetical protein